MGSAEYWEAIAELESVHGFDGLRGIARNFFVFAGGVAVQARRDSLPKKPFDGKYAEVREKIIFGRTGTLDKKVKRNPGPSVKPV